MKIRKIISAILTMSVMSACIIPIAKADGLYSEKFDMTKVKADKTDGVTKEVEVCSLQLYYITFYCFCNT